MANEMRNRRLTDTIKFRSLLTPEQLKEYMELRKHLPLPRNNARRPKR
jgi:hypothetical protein